MRPHGHAVIDPDFPMRTGLCDRCGGLHNFHALQFQLRWSGVSLINTGYLVCPTCLDEPAPFERIFVLPPDPPPTYNARLINYPDDMEDWISWEDGTKLVEEDDVTDVTEEGDPSTTGGNP